MDLRSGEEHGRSARLFGLVEAYANLGDHRTGTPADHETSEWFAAELESRGARVERLRYELERYDATWQVSAGGSELNALPRFYGPPCAVGPAEVNVRGLDPDVAVGEGLEAELVLARNAGESLVVVATGGRAGRLSVPNVAPLPHPGPPALMVAGSAVPEGPVVAALSARVVRANSTNVVGCFGAGDRPALVIATPLSGWFRCAGERGTGIAVALQVAEELADVAPVIVVGTTGHELQFLGLDRLLAGWSRPTRAVVHIGASVAAGEAVPGGGLDWAATRLARTDRSAGSGARVAAALAPAYRSVAFGATSWIGEAQGWARLGAPMLSLTGNFSLFHTPDDLPALSTTPRLVTQAAAAVTSASRALYEAA